MKEEIIKLKYEIEYFPVLVIEKRDANSYYTAGFLDGNYELKDVKDYCHKVLKAVEDFEKKYINNHE